MRRCPWSTRRCWTGSTPSGRKRPRHETIILRWICQQVLEALADARAAPLLQQWFVDVQARATAMTDAANRDHPIQAQPV